MHPNSLYRWCVCLALVLLAAGCHHTEQPTGSALSATEPLVRWQCRSDLEINCDAEQCEAADSFTPMDVRFDEAGSMSVCAYSGCWEGTGTVVENAPFFVVIGPDLPFSTGQDSAAIVIVLDRTDLVGILKVETFAQPLLCEQQPGLP